MNPIQMMRLYRRVNKVANLLRDAMRSYERDPMKSLFSSKIFWLNLISATIEVLQYLSVMELAPPGVIAVSVNLLTIALRMITTASVYIVKPEGT